MTVFSTSPATSLRAAPDPGKHVRYTYGMVLDAEDFTQEFAYLATRDQRTLRELIGYGTVSGLKVTYEQNGGKPRLLVGPGTAVTPRGEMVHVPRAQCALLNDWLKTDDAAKQADALQSSPTTSSVDVYVTLCYRECETDSVPIPGEPCRDESEMMAPSRVADDFGLELRFKAPEQPDERAIRDFVDWLSAVPIVDGASSVTLPQFLDALRSAAALIGSPPSSPPDFMYGAPPASLSVGRADACRYFRAAYRLWAVELRPVWDASWWQGQSCGCDGATAEGGATSPEACVLLARVSLTLQKTLVGAQAWQVAASPDPVIDEEDRPFLVPLRLLQELMLCGTQVEGVTDGTVVAAGMPTVSSSATPPPATGPYQLLAFRPATPPASWTAGDFWLLFKGYSDPTAVSATAFYVVNATPIVGASLNPRLEVAGFDPEGIRLRLKNNTSVTSPVGQQFLVEVKQFAK